MTRKIIYLALVSGIPFDTWWEQDWRTIVTALDIIEKSNVEEDPEGRQMSG